jgi:uncharacterized protein YciI
VKTLPRRALLLALLALGGIACRTTAEPRRATAEPRRATAEPPAMRSYVLAFLVTRPEKSSKTREDPTKIQEAHMANVRRLADEGKLLLAGPFGNPTPDPRLRGAFVFDTDDVETARAWANSDPAVQAGVLAMELAAFRSPSPLRRAVELDKAENAAFEKSGKPVEFSEHFRNYVMVLAREPDRAKVALTELRKQGKVLVEGELDGSPRGKYLAVLDAENVKDAAMMIGEASIVLRDHDLAQWGAMKSLVGLAAPAK